MGRGAEHQEAWPAPQYLLFPAAQLQTGGQVDRWTDRQDSCPQRGSFGIGHRGGVSHSPEGESTQASPIPQYLEPQSLQDN